jgi:hypothetical protein
VQFGTFAARLRSATHIATPSLRTGAVTVRADEPYAKHEIFLFARSPLRTHPPAPRRGHRDLQATPQPAQVGPRPAGEHGQRCPQRLSPPLLLGPLHSDGELAVNGNGGQVLTAYHVVEEQREVFVLTADSKVYLARVLAASKRDDVALLQIEGASGSFPTAALGDSDLPSSSSRRCSPRPFASNTARIQPSSRRRRACTAFPPRPSMRPAWKSGTPCKARRSINPPLLAQVNDKVKRCGATPQPPAGTSIPERVGRTSPAAGGDAPWQLVWVGA